MKSIDSLHVTCIDSAHTIDLLFYALCGCPSLTYAYFGAWS